MTVYMYISLVGKKKNYKKKNCVTTTILKPTCDQKPETFLFLAIQIDFVLVFYVTFCVLFEGINRVLD